LTGLHSPKYNPLVCQINEKESIIWLELQAKLLSYEKRLEQLNAGITLINLGQPTANYANSRGGSSGNFSNINQSYPQSQHQSS